MSTEVPPPRDREVPKARRSLDRSLELLWDGRPATTKGPKPTLVLEQIVDTAIGIADADGVDALSMRRLARELDVGTMSLYRYVPDKSVLLDLMLERASDPSSYERDVLGRSWREALEAVAWEARALYLRHPWLLHDNWTRPVIGPNNVTRLELAMSTLADLPLSDREKIMTISTLNAYVNGTVREQILYEQAAQDTGVGEVEFWEAQLPMLERAMGSGRYPTLAAMAEDSFEGGWEETFALGLQYLFDGIAADVEGRHRGGTAGSAPGPNVRS